MAPLAPLHLHSAWARHLHTAPAGPWFQRPNRQRSQSSHGLSLPHEHRQDLTSFITGPYYIHRLHSRGEHSTCHRLRHRKTTNTRDNKGKQRRQGRRGVDFRLLRTFPKAKPNSELKIELFNTQSLCNKTTFIFDHICDKKVDILCLTETWHKPSSYMALNEACPPGYTYLEKARTTGRGGGLAVFHRRDLPVTPLPLPELTTFESLLFNCKLQKETILILLIYRPPKLNTGFIMELQDLLTSLCATSHNTLILGDFNIHVHSSNNRPAAEFLELLDCLHLTQHVSVPTHTKGHTLDLVITDNAPISNLQVEDLGVSDHKLISMTLPLTKTYMQTKRQIQFRSVKTIDLTLFNKDIQDISLPTKFTSVNDYVNHYNSSLRSILDTHAPVKTRTVTFSRSAPWFTPELRIMKTAGRALERQFISSGLLGHKQAYRKHQKTYSVALTAARSHYFSLKISNSRGNSKQLFSEINSLVKPSTYTLADTSIDHCNRFMDFFINKVASIQSALPVIAESQVDITLPMQSNTFSAFSVVTQLDVEKIVKSMKTSTCVLDPLPTALLKSNITAICPLITTIINQSLRASQVPPSLKTAVIHPYLKKPSLDPNILAHYRPVSNLPFISKVLEKVVAAQLHQHLHIHNFYEKFQSGFRSAHSTETALVRVMNDLLMTADQGSPSLLLLLDLSAAFDTVNHTILLNRLQSEIGLSGTALKWFHSYLTNRTEYVSLGQSKSSTHTVTCGVPQGSVLGPTLFTIYMLPLGHIINKHKVSFHCYADDTQLYMKMDSTSPTALPSSLQLCLEEIKAWMTANSLRLNSNKMDVILLGTPHQTQSSNLSSISIFGLNIPFSTTVTNLGVRIDSNLTFNSHIRHLSKVSFLHLKNIARLRP
uniref:Reverse transcriptase domain-containing protein n=1 Tax=Poecilia mexicana TaxID=48701 RepID=A0A3B3Y420_9TELE